jgi:hypothetical protein
MALPEAMTEQRHPRAYTLAPQMLVPLVVIL